LSLAECAGASVALRTAVEESIMVRKLFTLVAISAGLALSACNTVKGVGEDVQSVGEAGDKAI
jgi:predicted small secreted protein